jgi:Fic family protein
MVREAHIPKLLPPPIDYNLLISEISQANNALGELRGRLTNLLNRDLLISPILTKEAVASSKIEGTQATFEEVLRYEAEGKISQKDDREQDIREILNYRKAVRMATEKIKDRPLAENLLKEIHSILLDSVRGEYKNRGNLRRIQVYIGQPGDEIEDAKYIPPEIQHLPSLLSNWEKYVNNDEPEKLVQIGVAHYQFEAIHPFMDGNGRIGRLLIPLMLFQKGFLDYPILYISEYFEKDRENYYKGLRLVDEQQRWVEWLKYFLKALATQADKTKSKVDEILSLYDKVKENIYKYKSIYAMNLLDIIFSRPIISSITIKEELKTNSYQTIYNLIEKFEERKILREATGRKRNRIYVYDELINILNK